MDEAIKAFPVGSWVRSTERESFGPLMTNGMDGEVRMHHADAGVLVRLYISRIYMPSFWFKATELVVSNEIQVLPVPCDALEYAMGGRSRGYSNTPIFVGVMKSWMLYKLRVAPKHPLEEVITKLSYSEVATIWGNISDVALNEWAQANDTRARRTVVTNASDNLEATSLSVRRNKLL